MHPSPTLKNKTTSILLSVPIFMCIYMHNVCMYIWNVVDVGRVKEEGAGGLASASPRTRAPLKRLTPQPPCQSWGCGHIVAGGF